MKSDQTRQKWDARYRDADGEGEVSEVLRQHQHLLPPTAKALDLACGLGANALFLAKRGLDVHAWDISSVAIERLESRAQRAGVIIHTQVRDCIAEPPEANAFDLIVISRFLNRDLCPAIERALQPQGLLFYQTFVQQQTHCDGRPRNPDYLLQPGEMPLLFGGLQVLYFEEAGEAKLVAIKSGTVR